VSRRALHLAALAVVALAQLAVPAAMILGRERTLAEGTQWRFRTEPVDPADAFRGRYLALAFVADSAPLPAGTEVAYGERVYVPLARDAQGFATLGPVALAPPALGDYLRVRTYSALPGDDGAQRVQVRLPFDRLYLDEDLAPQAEAAWRDAGGPLPPAASGETTARAAWALVRVRHGEAVLEDVVVEGRSIRELARGG
jgi:uncharacterized membrane-anchored protein